jgi:hypothetical protein
VECAIVRVGLKVIIGKRDGGHWCAPDSLDVIVNARKARRLTFPRDIPPAAKGPLPKFTATPDEFKTELSPEFPTLQAAQKFPRLSPSPQARPTEAMLYFRSGWLLFGHIFQSEPSQFPGRRRFQAGGPASSIWRFPHL